MVKNFQSQNLMIHLYHYHHYTILDMNSQAKKVLEVFVQEINLKSNIFYLKMHKIDDNGTVYCGCCDDPTTINCWEIW